MPDDSGKGGFLGKVFATIFGALVCPLLVGIGVRYFAPKDEPKPQPSTAQLKSDKEDTSEKDKSDKDKSDKGKSDKGKPDTDKLEGPTKDRLDKGGSVPAVSDLVQHMAEPALGRSWYTYERLPEKDKAGKDSGTAPISWSREWRPPQSSISTSPRGRSRPPAARPALWSASK